jgi:uncharacterized protein YndB with AHSA1/START domain
MQGQLEQRAGQWQLRFTRQLPHPQEKVWRAITEPNQLKAWFPDQIVVSKWAVGTPLKFESEYGDHDGEVLAFEPPSVLEFRWGPDVLRFELAPHAQGTVLTLIDRIDEKGKAARDAAGWHECLDRLEHSLSGSKAATPGEVWKQVHPQYQEQFGPEASTIGPPAPVK